MFWLGVASGLGSIAFVVAVFRVRARVAAIVLAAQLSFAAAGAVFVRAAQEAGTALAVVLLLGLAVFGLWFACCAG
jgi:hypothetical protein